VAAEHPAAVTTWFTDPMAVPHGGDSLTELMARVQRWLAEVPDGHTVAVCGPSVVRAAVVGVLGAPAEAFWRLDRWTVRSTGAPVGRRS
jgi:broad specificity phosphatase PhoE